MDISSSFPRVFIGYLPARRYASAGNSHSNVSLSVHPSVRPSVRDGPKFGFAELRQNYSAELFGLIRLGNVVLFGRTSVLFGVIFLPRTMSTTSYNSFHCHFFQ